MLRDRIAVRLSNLIMTTIATRTYRDRFKRLTKNRLDETLRQALNNQPDLPEITVRPGYRFGRAAIAGVECSAYAGRVAAGEDPLQVADDYGITRREILLACWHSGIYGTEDWEMALRPWAEQAYRHLASGDYDQIPDPPSKEDDPA